MNQRSSRLRYEDYRRRKSSRAENGPDRETHHGVTPSHGRLRSSNELLGQFWGLLRGQRGPIAFALATLTLATFLKLLPPLAGKLVIDHVLTGAPLPQRLLRLGLPDEPKRLLLLLAGLVICVSLLATAIHLWGRWYAAKVLHRVQVATRRRAFAHAVRLPLHRVYQLKSGGAASLLREDAGGVGELVFSLIYDPWRAVVQFLGSLVILFYVDWRLTLGGVLLLPVVYFSHRTWINRIRPLHRDVRNQRQEVDSHATEAFGGMRVVRTFRRERAETARFVVGNHLLIRKQLFVWWWTRLIEIVWDVLIPLSGALLLTYGGYRVLQGQLTVGDLTMFLVYLTMLLGPLATLANSATTFQNNLAGLDRVLDLLEEPQETTRTPARVSLDRSRVHGALTFQHVSFHYPASTQHVLEDVNLQVGAGETVALVGRSGAGKTTLCNLVARFYDPTAGAVLLDGVDLRDIQLESYRSLLGIVEQDVFLFDGTIGENIGYAVRRASIDQIQAAAKVAHAHDFIAEMEHGYQTVIGERGVRLSGGQRQRLAIARAVLANPRILILDEATSNLDSESERLIQLSLEQLMRGRTNLVIAHRLSTIMHADRIVVLDHGQVAEIGSHAELMRRSGPYRQMVELQMRHPAIPTLEFEP